MNKKLHCKEFLSKIVCIMLFLLLTNSIVSANSNIVELMQQKSITINSKNKQIRDILKDIRTQTGLNFSYDERIFPENFTKSIQVKNENAENTLQLLFNNSDYTYSINGNSIVITKRKAAPTAQKPNSKITLKGRVLSEDNKPLPGATLLIIGTQNGTIANEKGEFIISMNAGQTLEVNFLGYQIYSKVITASNNAMVITLKVDALAVDDIIVTGIFNKKAESFTGSSTTITEKEIKQFGSRNILTTLRNIDPAFNIIENNMMGSNPNTLPELQIRGNSSLPNVDELKNQERVNLNTPLVVLDGFEVPLQRMMDMNDNDIASITLLKDASATSIYGSRGANGVIVITTKVPEAGKLRVSYRGNLNIELPDLTSYSLLNAREKLDFEHAVGRYDVSRAEYDVKAKQYYNWLRSEVNAGVDTYWLSKPLNTSFAHRHNLRLEGGDDTFRYSAALQYNNTEGVMKGSNRNNFNGTVTLSYNYKNLRFTNQLTIGLNKSNESPFGSFDTYAKLNPYYRPYDEFGKPVKKMGIGPNGETYYNITSGMGGNNQSLNPLYDAELNIINDNRSTDITNNFSLDWTILTGFIAKVRFGIGQTNTESNKFFPADHTKFDNFTKDSDILRKGSYSLGHGKSFNYDGSVTLSYSKLFAEKHMLYAGADFNIRSKENSNVMMVAEGFPNEALNFPAMALQYAESGKPSGSESLTRSVGFTGTINYSYNNRYFADLSARMDGSSAFGSSNRFAPFWSVGFGWNLHNESFFKNVKGVNMLKLRGSAGITGSQNFNSYQALSTYKYYTDDRYDSWLGAYLMGLGNENLKWQQKMNYNIGLDTKFLNNRLMINADYYIEETKDLISSVNIPLANGFSSYTENIGKLTNKGFELKVSGVLVTNENWFWSVTGAMIHNKNKVAELSQALKDAQKEFEADKGSNPNMLYREGYSIDAIWVVPSLGIDPSTGQEVFLDRFGNVTYTWDARNLAYCGLNQPKYSGNINTVLKYKNLTFTMSFGYRFGGQQYNETLINKVENVNYNNNLDSRVATDRWRNPGDKAFFKGINVTTATKKTSRFVQDENTINCQNMNLSYDIKADKLKKIGIEYLNINANMDNVFHISTIKRERGTQYPFSRLVSIGLNLTF